MSQDLSRHREHIKTIGHGRFDANIAWLEKATIRIKPSFFPFPDASTTLGNTIWLERHWNDILFSAQCAVLCHEARHLRQWQVLGRIQIMTNYLIPASRLDLEKEAYQETLAYWILSAAIPNFSKMVNPISAAKQNRLCQEIVGFLRDDYLMKPDEGDLWRWLVDAVAAEFAKRP